MSSRAARISTTAVEPFRWGAAAPPAARDRHATPWVAAPAVVHEPPSVVAPDPASIERDAFATGYAQGERAGTEAGAARAEAMLRRLAETLEELQRLRGDLVRRTEREVVELALAIAGKILHREASIDRDLVLAMARVALDRLSDATAASVRLHPDDYAAAMAGRGPTAAPHGVQILADPSVRRGGCVVRSDVGSIDVGLRAQLDEITRALLAVDAAGPAGGFRDDAAA